MPSFSQTPSSKQRDGRRAPPLPSNFTSIKDILDEQVPVGRQVCVLGIVKDFRAPIATGRTGTFIYVFS